MPAPKNPNTAAATAAVRRRGEETMAAKLRARGWTCVAPDTCSHGFIPDKNDPAEECSRCLASQCPEYDWCHLPTGPGIVIRNDLGRHVHEMSEPHYTSHYDAADEPGLLDHLSAPPAKHVCGWRCPLPCPDAQHKSDSV